MNKKYRKPTLTTFPVANAAADGFEILGACVPGGTVGPYTSACFPGNVPKPQSTCFNGGGAGSVGVSNCSGGSSAEYNWDSGTACFTGGVPDVNGNCASGGDPS